MNAKDLINIEKDVDIHLENQKLSGLFFCFLWILYAVVCMTKNCYNGSLADIVSEGVLTKSQTGSITALFYAVYTPLQIVGGFLSDRYSPQRIIKIGLIGAMLANTVIFFNQNYYVMLAAWVFNGMIQFGIWPSVFKIISSQLVRSQRQKMIFYITFSSMAGTLLSYIVAAFVTNWRYNFAISAISLLFLFVGLHVFGKVLTPYLKRNVKKDSPAINIASTEKKPDISKMKLFAASGFFFLLFGMILTVTVSQTRSVLTSVMFIENYDAVTPSFGNILTSIMLTSSIIGTFVAGNLMKRLKNEVVFIVILSAIKLPFLLACTFVGTLPVSAMITLLSIIACLESTTDLAKSYYTMYFAKHGISGTAAGILNAGNAFAYMLAAYVMPRIVEKFGWHTLLTLLPIMIGIAILSFCLIIKRFGKFKRNEF